MINQFPLSECVQVGSSYETKHGTQLEPSGLTVLNNTLYMASDNGYLMSMNLGGSLNKPWTQDHNFTNDSGNDSRKKYDFECITSATGKLMIGIEGRDSYDPHIIRYNTSHNEPTGSVWKIADHPNIPSNKGMESLAFVPEAECPGFDGNPYYGGYFFTAYQGHPGNIFVYDLPKGSGKHHTVDHYFKQFPIDCQLMASDICFANGYLFVLFDGSLEGEDGPDELHLYRIHSDSLQYISSCYLPIINDTQLDFEGITIDGSNMYLAKDTGHRDSGVWCYTDYSIDKFLSS